MSASEEIVSVDGHTSLHCTGGLRAGIIPLESLGVMRSTQQVRSKIRMPWKIHGVMPLI